MTRGRVFIVEVSTTQADPATFRASVRAVEEEERQVFDDPDSLSRFLAGVALALRTGHGAIAEPGIPT